MDEQRRKENEQSEIQIQVRELRKQVQQLKCQDSKAVSYSDYYNDKKSENRVYHWQIECIDNAEELLPATLLSAINETGSETDAVKPFWEKFVKEEANFHELSAGYEVAKLGTKIPDIAISPSNIAHPSSAEFVAYGDCKGSKWTGKSGDELGQGMQYGHRILDASPLRSLVYGFFTNNSIVVLFKTQRNKSMSNMVEWYISSPLTFIQGMAKFYQLLKEDENGFVAPPSFDSKLLKIEKPLGKGSTCSAFWATYDGSQVVAKLYNSRESVEAEEKMLLKVSTIVNDARTSSSKALCQIPRVLGSEGCWLLVEPRGRRVRHQEIKPNHVEMLVSTIQTVHEGGILHRDLRFANIFLLDCGGVLLNDWGASIQDRRYSQLIIGCPEPWAHPDLAGKETGIPLPKHDLHSLTSSFLSLIAPGIAVANQKELFASQLQAAEECNYTQVCERLSCCLPK